jgi:hypothetical protein
MSPIRQMCVRLFARWRSRERSQYEECTRHSEARCCSDGKWALPRPTWRGTNAEVNDPKGHDGVNNGEWV